MSEDIKNIYKQINELKLKLLGYRTDMKYSKIEDTSVISKTKKEIARLLTILNATKNAAKTQGVK